MSNDDFNVEDLENDVLGENNTDSGTARHAAEDEPTPLADEAEAGVNGPAEAAENAEALAAAEKAAAEKAAAEAAEKEAEAKRLYDAFIGATETALKSPTRETPSRTWVLVRPRCAEVRKLSSRASMLRTGRPMRRDMTAGRASSSTS